MFHGKFNHKAYNNFMFLIFPRWVHNIQTFYLIGQFPIFLNTVSYMNERKCWWFKFMWSVGGIRIINILIPNRYSKYLIHNVKNTISNTILLIFNLLVSMFKYYNLYTKHLILCLLTVFQPNGKSIIIYISMLQLRLDR